MKSNPEVRWTANNILEDAISCQKHLTNLYNSACVEASTPVIRDDFLNILMDSHQLHQDLFAVMERRGLYMPQGATPQDVTQAWQKFSSQHTF
jgi:spore coat protein CotF